MSVSLKLRQLESKISTLQSQHQNLLKNRQQEIAGLITSLDLTQVEDNILFGTLLFQRIKSPPKTPYWRPGEVQENDFCAENKKNLLEFSRKIPPLAKQL